MDAFYPPWWIIVAVSVLFGIGIMVVEINEKRRRNIQE